MPSNDPFAGISFGSPTTQLNPEQEPFENLTGDEDIKTDDPFAGVSFGGQAIKSDTGGSNVEPTVKGKRNILVPFTVFKKII